MLLGPLAYAGVFGVTLWQAQRGQALTDPDALTLSTLGGLLALLGVGATRLAGNARRSVAPAA